MRIVSFAVLATIAPTGCASSVTITSMAPGSAVLVDGMQVAVTPARVTVSSQREHVITVRGSGGEHSCRLGSRASAGWEILGIVASRSWIVDLVNGSGPPLDITECTMPA
jgi:PEGA domain